MVKYYCDYCKKEIPNIETGYKIAYTSAKRTHGLLTDVKTVYTCHDCYWKIQGFIKEL